MVVEFHRKWKWEFTEWGFYDCIEYKRISIGFISFFFEREAKL